MGLEKEWIGGDPFGPALLHSLWKGGYPDGAGARTGRTELGGPFATSCGLDALPVVPGGLVKAGALDKRLEGLLVGALVDIDATSLALEVSLSFFQDVFVRSPELAVFPAGPGVAGE